MTGRGSTGSPSGRQPTSDYFTIISATRRRSTRRCSSMPIARSATASTSFTWSELTPVEAMRKLVGFTFDHFRKHPWFIRLLATENMQRAEFVKRIADIKQLHSPIVGQLRTVLAAGQRARLFRRGVDPIHLYISIAGVSYFYLLQHPHAVGDLRRAARIGERDGGAPLACRGGHPRVSARIATIQFSARMTPAPPGAKLGVAAK